MIWYSFFLGYWRRWFGGGLKFLGDNRAIQHLVGGGVLLINLVVQGYDLLQALLAVCAFQGLFWARSHGCCFDFGHGEPDPERYEQLWYWKYVKKIIPESEWYGRMCDYVLMLVRYTIPAIVVAIILQSFLVCFAGLIVAVIYSVCWESFDKGRTETPTEDAEFLAGFFVGMLFM